MAWLFRVGAIVLAIIAAIIFFGAFQASAATAFGLFALAFACFVISTLAFNHPGWSAGPPV